MTHHKIFISKGTLDMGRNRSIRKLEAQLDKNFGQQNAGRLSRGNKPLKENNYSISADTYEQGINESNSLSNVLSGGTKQNEKGNNFQREVPRNADIHPAYNVQETKSVFTNSDSSPAHTLGDNSEANTLLFPQEDYKIDFCNYEKICPLHKYSMKCIFGKDECRSKKFYDKYKNKLAPYERENPHIYVWEDVT